MLDMVFRFFFGEPRKIKPKVIATGLPQEKAEELANALLNTFPSEVEVSEVHVIEAPRIELVPPPARVELIPPPPTEAAAAPDPEPRFDTKQPRLSEVLTLCEKAAAKGKIHREGLEAFVALVNESGLGARLTRGRWKVLSRGPFPDEKIEKLVRAGQQLLPK